MALAGLLRKEQCMLDILGKECTNKEIKKILSHQLNKPVKIKYNLGPNKYEIYEVIIKNLYNSIFIVEEIDNKNIKKSFSYADIITKTIKIYE